MHLIANSYGCEIACEFACNYPEIVEKLVLIGPASDPHRPSLFNNFLRLTYDGLVERPKMSLVLLVDLIHMGLKRAVETSQIMIDYDYRPRLPHILAPTLIIRGGRDALAPQSWVEEVNALIAGSRLEVVENAPHNVQFTAPAPLAELVLGFLSQ